MVKAIFFDIDGTLVSFKTHRMTDYLKEKLHELQAKGVKLFIASGRARLVMNNLDDFPFDGYVEMNGAKSTLYGELIDSHPLPKETSLRIAEIASRENVSCWVFADDVAGINFSSPHAVEVADMINLHPAHFLDLAQVAKEHAVYEYTMFFDEEQERRILHPALKNVCYTRWHPYFMDIVPEGLSKSYSASKILERIGVTREECMAFGDGGNDIPIIEYAGIGVAMGNATDDVKAAADYVTGSVDEDGVVTALRHFGVL